MPRKTRTAARAEEEIDVAVDTSGNSESASSNGTEEAAGAEQLTANKNKGTRKNQNAERQPLGEVVVNLKEESKKQSEITTEDIGSGQDENQTAKKKGKGGKGSVRKKAGKKTGKGKKTEEKHETEKNLNSMPEFSVVLDKNAIEESSASEGAAEQFKQPMSNGSFSPFTTQWSSFVYFYCCKKLLLKDSQLNQLTVNRNEGAE